MVKEIWKPVVGYEDYCEVSNQGKIRSLGRYVKGRWGSIHFRKGIERKQCYYPNGYLFVALSVGGKMKQLSTHRIVAAAFLGESDLEVNHKNGHKDDNRVENLEYVTRRENQLHSYRVLHRKPICSWKGKFGFDHNKSFHVKATNIIDGKVIIFGSYREAERNGFNRTKISNIINTELTYNNYKFERIW